MCHERMQVTRLIRVWVTYPYLVHKQFISITDKHSPVTNMLERWNLSVLQTNPFAKGSYNLNVS